MVFKQEELVIEGDRAAEVTSAAGTDTGGFLGLPATGRPFHLPMVILYTFDGPTIVHERRIYDFTGMLVQIGVLKAKPA
jgi:predicted ester cyclase